MAGLLIKGINRFHRFHGAKVLCFLTQATQQNSTIFSRFLYASTCNNFKIIKRFESSNKPNEIKPPPTMKEKFKKAVSQYGSTVIIFHVSISLVSLGACYALISSGLDVSTLMAPMGISDETANKIATNAGTFAIAYAVHKVFAPVRITITLTVTPFIVRYLRNIGVLRKTK